MQTSVRSVMWGFLVVVLGAVLKIAYAFNTSCGWTFNETVNGKLQSPGFPGAYGDGEFCNYAITLPSDKRVKLTFLNASFEVFEEQLVDYVLLFDGADCMADRIAAVVNMSTPSYVATGNQLTALFVSDITMPKGPFEAEFTEEQQGSPTEPIPPFPGNKILENCGQELNEDAGEISYHVSEGYNRLCIWRITVSSDKKIQLNFTSVKIESPGDWIRILDGKDCGANVTHYIAPVETKPPTTITSTSNTMLIVFSSSSGSLTDGFEASYSSTPLVVVNPVTGMLTLSETTGDLSSSNDSETDDLMLSTSSALLLSYSKLITLSSGLLVAALRAPEFFL